MKLILDFDDVLFNNTKGLKIKIFEVLVRHGIVNAESSYLKKREGDTPFSLKSFLHEIIATQGVTGVNEQELYEEICESFPDLVNEPLLALIREMKISRNDCYIVTSGEKEYQYAKIEGSGIASIFNVARVVGHSKKTEVEKICRDFPGDEIIFVDDKDKFFRELNMEAYPNLKTVLFNEHGLENLKAEIEESILQESSREQKQERERPPQQPSFGMK